MSDENKEEVSSIVVEEIVVDEIIDIENDTDLVQGWYDEARGISTTEGLQELIKRVLSVPKMTSGTTPHAYASIVLASLKMALESKHGKMDVNQWVEFKAVMDAAIGDVLMQVAIEV